MKKYLSLPKIVFTLAFIVLVIGFSAFGQQEKRQKDSFRKEQPGDSSTSGKRYRIEPSNHLDKLDLELKNLDLEMKNLDIELKNIDFSKMQKDIDESMKKVDWEKINKELEQAKVALKEVDFKELQKELEKAQVKMKADMKNFKAQQIDHAKIGRDVEEAMKGARKSMEAAREEMQFTRSFMDVLIKDGVIDNLKTRKIEVKNGELYIDGKKQPKEISDKYKSYYRRDNFSINFGDDDDDRI